MMTRGVIQLVVVVILCEGGLAAYDQWIEGFFQFPTQYQADVAYCTVNNLLENIQLIAIFGALVAWIPVSQMNASAWAQSGFWMKLYDTIGMTWNDLESYDSVGWEFGCFALGLVVAYAVAIPRKIRHNRKEEEKINRKVDEFIL